MKRWLILCFLLAGAASGEAPLSCPGTDFRTPGDEVKKQDGWELHTWIMAGGTRSEGRHGGLLHQGKWVKGKTGQVLETPLGSLRYAGDFGKRQFPWSESGWLLK